jgi:DNA-binding transcriptional MerR regulator
VYRKPVTPSGEKPSQRLKMKDLERATGVGREAIRFYIREGLLPEPLRPARNVAWYDESFVERIRLIKRLQSERFLPLEMIKGLVGVPEVPSAQEVDTLLALDGKLSPASERVSPEPETPAHLAERVGLPAIELRELARLGAIEITTRNGRQQIEGRSVEIVELWARMRTSGFSDALGFGPENMTLPVQTVEWLAQEQLRLFTRQVTGRVDPEESRRLAEVGLDCVPRLVALLHESALLRLIARGNLPAASEEENASAGPKAS